MKKRLRTPLRGMMSLTRTKVILSVGTMKMKKRLRTANQKKNCVALLQIPGSCMEHNLEELRYSIY